MVLPETDGGEAQFLSCERLVRGASLEGFILTSRHQGRGKDGR